MIAPAFPRQVRLELSGYCNAHCHSCHGHGAIPMSRARGYMDWGLLERCVEDIRGWPQPPVELVPSNYGETWLYPKWFEALQLISRRLSRTQIVVPTNGTLLTDGSVGKLASIPTVKLVNFSVNALFPETYEAFHQLPGQKSLETITRAIVSLRQLRPDITIWVSMVRSSEYQSPREVELFTEHWSEYGIVQLNQAEHSNRPPLSMVKQPCRSLFSDLVVLWDGRCMSCCYAADAQEELVVGDATRERLLDIWHGKRFMEIRRLHTEGRRGELSTCRICTFA